jgi:HD domain
MAPAHAIDTKNPGAIRDEARGAFAAMGHGDSAGLIDRLIADVTDMFTGKFAGYRAIDMRYHDFEHTLQATLCLLKILQGRHAQRAQPEFSRRDCEIALMAVLLHDTGYLKHTDDTAGTGAKYTMVHVRRSCDFARDYLPRLGVAPGEIEDVCQAISCTGPLNKIGAVDFRRPEGRVLACILVTADYLGQMAAHDYVEELPILFGEFQEAYEFEGFPEAKRMFHSETELLRKTPAFWEGYVRPMLERDAGGVFHFLDGARGDNFYVGAVEANMAEVRRRIAALPS